MGVEKKRFRWTTTTIAHFERENTHIHIIEEAQKKRRQARKKQKERLQSERQNEIDMRQNFVAHSPTTDKSVLVFMRLFFYA